MIKFTNILEKLNKSALPVAIRTSLNSVAFDVKQNTMPTESQAVFLHRQKTFFKANSKVEMAQGFNINQMQSTVGFFENRLSNKNTNYAVKDLEQQEHGGKISHKTFIPMKQARVGGSGVTKTANRLANIDKIVNAKTVKSIRSRSKKQALIRAAIIAKKTGGNNALILGNVSSNGSQTLFRVDRINVSKGLNLKLTPLYDVKKNRSITVQRTEFMKHASMLSHKKLPHFYIENALKQVKKYAGKL